LGPSQLRCDDHGGGRTHGLQLIFFFFVDTIMDPEIWGPPAWVFIFSIIDQMPDGNPPDGYILFFQSLTDVLPCGICKRHYRRYCMENPIPIHSREATRQWAQNLRNQIRDRKKTGFFERIAHLLP